jgi:hypothetical protein
MNDRPDARDLIAIARDTYTSEILPALPDSLRFTGLMIANALGIVQRETGLGDGPARAELERLRKLLPSRHDESRAGEALRAALEDYNRRLAREIRAGRFDGEERAAMLQHLRQTTAEKLAVSNPKALRPAGRGDGVEGGQ